MLEAGEKILKIDGGPCQLILALQDLLVLISTTTLFLLNLFPII